MLARHSGHRGRKEEKAQPGLRVSPLHSMALLTGLGGSLWLRALWMLPISVCELECDRPSKYGLDKEGIDVISHDPQYNENEV